jgi:hypothetical protein
MKTEEGFEEYEKFYDFSALFEEKLREQGTIVPGIEYEKVKVYTDEGETKMEQEGNDEEWEDEEEDEEWEDEEGEFDDG